MSCSFFAELNPPAARYNQLAALYPDNPFCTVAFVRARQALGARPWVFWLGNGDELLGGCTAFMTGGRLKRKLIIQSMAVVHEPDVFWQGMSRVCGENQIATLEVRSFGSEGGTISGIGRERWRRKRAEYRLDLNNPHLWGELSTNHRRNIRRAEKKGLTIRCSSDPRAGLIHARLVRASTERRQAAASGESLSAEARWFLAFVEHGAGELFQAEYENEAVSSILVLNARRGAYYHSAGTGPQGIRCGASPFLLYGVTKQLRDRGLAQFNLGGADVDQSGLIRFKSGFGAERVELEDACFDLVSPLKRTLLDTAQGLRDRTTALLKKDSA